MQRSIAIIFILSLTAAGSAAAQQMSSAPPGYATPMTPRMVVTAPPPAAMQARLGGGFIEFLFGGNAARAAPVQPAPLAGVVAPPNAAPDRRPIYASTAPNDDVAMSSQQAVADGMDPRYLRQEVGVRLFHALFTLSLIPVRPCPAFLILFYAGPRQPVRRCRPS